MSWILYAFLCAFGEGAKDIISNKTLGHSDPIVITWAIFSLGGLFAAPLLFFEELPLIGPYYFHALITHGILFGLSMYLYIKAIALSGLNKTIPLVMLTPAFMLVSSPLIIGEFPNTLGLLGVLLVVMGSYLMNASKTQSGLLSPFYALFEERGAVIMFCVAILYSLTSVIDKVGIRNSAPIFWGVTLHVFIAAYFGIILLFRRKSLGISAKGSVQLGLTGFFHGVQLIGYLFAMTTGLAVYVLSIKRLSVLLVVITAYYLYNEELSKMKLTSIIVMLIGVFCIAFS